MIIKLVVIRYPSIGDGLWSSTPETLTSAYDVSVNANLGDAKDTFSFKVPNIRNTAPDNIAIQDLVNIHLLINSESVHTSNMVLNGLVKAPEETVDDKKKFYRIKGVSFGEITGNALVFYDSDTTTDIRTAIIGIVNSVALRNANFGVTVDMPTTQSSGGSYPTIDRVKEFDRSLNTLLEKYLQDAYTGDGRYYWFVNNSKVLVIRPRNDASSVTLTEGVDFKTAKYSVNADDVKNFIVVKCGRDNGGNSITTRYDDPVSRAKYGFKYYMLIDESIAQRLKETGAYESDNDGLRVAAKAEGEELGKSFASIRNKGFRKFSVVMSPNHNFSVGDKLKITAPSYNVTGLDMRIKQVSYSKEDTTISLEEEVASI